MGWGGECGGGGRKGGGACTFLLVARRVFQGDVNAPPQMRRVKELPLSMLTAAPFYILMAAFPQRQARAAVLEELH